MDTPLPLPLPEPPAADVDQALDELRTARRELTDAQRIARMLAIDPGAGPRSGIEAQVATRRVELWRAEAAAAERRARALGLNVSALL